MSDEVVNIYATILKKQYQMLQDRVNKKKKAGERGANLSKELREILG